MKRELLSAVGVLLATPAVAAAGPQEDDAFCAERFIRAGAAAWADVSVSGDPAAIHRLIADDYRGLTSQGEKRTKADLLADATGGPSEYATSHVDAIDVRVFGDFAVAQGIDRFTRRDGAPAELYVWTDVWRRGSQGWKVVASQDAAKPSQPETQG